MTVRSRSAELRARNRRVFAWSLCLAALIHVAVFVLWPGDACGDQVIETVAGDLLYHWLPSERFPAPVDLIQPVTLTQAWN